jgi:tritrans,polycis-undecaprenyl-diphosphate synthase [geranylgeranyl-diphosphate specific]
MEIPNHIALIPDGNRRWAEKNSLDVWLGHERGAETIDKFLHWCLELNIPQVSLWALSTENLNRPKKELSKILELMHKWIEKYVNDSEIFDKYEVRVKFFGDFKRLPKTLVVLMEKLMKKTAKYRKKLLNIMVAYGGKFELTNAFKKIAEKLLKNGRIQITQKTIEKNLFVSAPIDLVIRTGGMSRLSNFFLWQTAYAEMYVTETLLPDFTKRELIKIIKWYNSVQRKFGK